MCFSQGNVDGGHRSALYTFSPHCIVCLLTANVLYSGSLYLAVSRAFGDPSLKADDIVVAGAHRQFEFEFDDHGTFR